MEGIVFLLLCSNVEVQDENTTIGLRDEQILRFDIAMTDTLLVQIVKAGHDLLKDILGHLFGIDVPRLSGQVVQDLHAVDIVHQDVDLLLLRIVEVLKGFDDVFVIQLLNHLGLLELGLSLLLIIFTADFDCVDLAAFVALLCAGVDASAATLSQLLAKRVLRLEANCRDALTLCSYLFALVSQEFKVRTIIHPKLIGFV